MQRGRFTVRRGGYRVNQRSLSQTAASDFNYMLYRTRGAKATIYEAIEMFNPHGNSKFKRGLAKREIATFMDKLEEALKTERDKVIKRIKQKENR